MAPPGGVRRSQHRNRSLVHVCTGLQGASIVLTVTMVGQAVDQGAVDVARAAVTLPLLPHNFVGTRCAKWADSGARVLEVSRRLDLHAMLARPGSDAQTNSLLKDQISVLPAGSTAHCIVEAASKFAMCAFGSTSARKPGVLRAALLRLLEATHGKFQCPSLVLSMVRLAGGAAPASGTGHGPSFGGMGTLSTPVFGGAGGGAPAGVGSDELDALRCLLGAGLAVEDVLTLPVRVGLQRPDLAAMQSALVRLVNRTASRALFDAASAQELSRELSTAFITKLLGPHVGDGVVAGDAHTVVGYQVG